LIVGVLWGIGAIYNIVAVMTLYGPELNNDIIIFYPTLVNTDNFLRGFLVALSVLQLPLAYEVVNGGSWSYFGGLGISAIELGIYAELVSLYYSVSTHITSVISSAYSLRTPLLLASLGVGTAYAVLIWVYFNLPHVRKYLWRWF